MIAVWPLTAADETAWDTYVLAHPGSHFAQRTAWRSLTSEFFGVEARWWMARDAAERIVGVLPLFRGKDTLFSSPGGLLADNELAAAALLEHARTDVAREGLRWLELRDQASAWPGLVTNPEHATLVLALAGDVDAQWKRFDAKLRNQIRKAEKSGLRCTRGRDQVDAFHRVFSENMRDLGTPAMEARYFTRALELYEDDADLFVVWLGERPIGGMFVVIHGTTIADPWASSLRRFFALCPNNLLYWEAIRGAIAAGARRFDFGRSQPGAGTYRFKVQYGAEPQPLAYQYALGTATEVPTLAAQKSSLDLAVRIWQRLPLAVTRAVGPRARRLFPEAL